MMGIEEVLLRVVVGWGSNNHIVSILIGCCAIKSGRQIQFFLCKIFFNILILNRRYLIIDFLYLLRDNIHCCNVVMLRQQSGDTHTDIAGSCDSNIHM